MAIQPIKIGAQPNDGTGDPLRTAFDKVNGNFAEVVTDLATKAAPDANGNLTYPIKQTAAGQIFVAPPSASRSRFVPLLAATFMDGSANTGCIVFKCPAPSSPNGGVMLGVNIAGYAYPQTGAHIAGRIDISLGAYFNNVPAISQVRQTTNGSTTSPVRVRVGFDASNNAVIILGETTSQWAYPAIGLWGATLGFNGADDAHVVGWTASMVTDLSTYKTVTDAPSTGGIADLKATSVQYLGDLSGVNANTFPLGIASTSNIQSDNVTFNLPLINMRPTSGRVDWIIETIASASGTAAAHTFQRATCQTAPHDGWVFKRSLTSAVWSTWEAEVSASVEITASQNLNLFIDNGFFYCRDNATATLALNFPAAIAGTLTVVKRDMGAGVTPGVTQTYTAYNNSATWIRTFITGATNDWSPWLQIATSDQVMMITIATGSVDLNGWTTPINTYRGTGADATLANHYPWPGVTGQLEVMKWAPGGTGAFQRFTANDGRVAVRNWNQSVWSAWTSPGQFPFRYRKGGQITVGNTAVLVGPGAWRSYADDGDIHTTAGISKNLQTSGAWAPGSNANGLFSGVAATATSYHFFVIKNSISGQVDAGFDTALNAANRPSGYDLYRRVCSVRNTNTGTFTPMVHRGDDWFLLAQAGVMVQSANCGAAFTNAVATGVLVPGVRTEALLNLYITTGGATAITVREPGVAGAPAGATNPASQMIVIPNTPNADQIRVFTDSSGNVQYAATVALTSGQFNLFINGYRDFLED